MARKKLIQIRRDTASDWASANPVLASGEAGLETDTNKLKYGNGALPWNLLPYFTAEGTPPDLTPYATKAELENHEAEHDNPHGVTKDQVGLSDVPNIDLTDAVAANTAKTSFDSGSKDKLDGIESGAQVNTVTSVAGKTGAVNLDKNDVGLGNVSNTSDANKPVSNATQIALNDKQDKLVSGNNIKTVNGNSLVGGGNVDITASVGFGNLTGDPADNIKLNNALGAKAEDANLVSHVNNTSNPHNVTKTQLNLGNVDNTSDANKPISTATQGALNTKLENITGLVTAGSNVSISGSGTTGSPYVVSSSGGGGGEGGGDVASVNSKTGVVVLNQDDVGDGSTYKRYSQTEKTKLSGIATNATANDTNANLKNRANHTGSQAISTVTGLQSALNDKLEDVDIADINATGSASGTTYLRGDGTWSTPAGGGGDVTGDTSSVNTAIPRFTDTSGKAIGNTEITISNDDNMTLPKDSTYSTGEVNKGLIYPSGVDVHWQYTQTVRPTEANDMDPTDTDLSMVGSAYRAIWDVRLEDNTAFIGPIASGGFFGPQGVFQNQGKIAYKYNATRYAMGPIGFADQITITNADGQNRNISGGWGFMYNRNYNADTGKITMVSSDTFEGTSAFVDNTMFTTANGGQIDGKANKVWHVGYSTIPYLFENTSMYRVVGFMAQEINGGGGYNGQQVPSDYGDVDEWIGFHARQFSRAGRNIGLLNESALVNQYLEFEIDSDEAEIPTNAASIKLNNTTGNPVTLASVPSIQDNAMDGQELTLLNISEDAITVEGEDDLAGSTVLSSFTLEQGDHVKLIYNEELAGWSVVTQSSDITKLAGIAAGAQADHGLLTGLGDDDHTQYALLAGRSGGQTLIGGTSNSDNLTLQAKSTAFNVQNAGRIKLKDMVVFDDNIPLTGNGVPFVSEAKFFGIRYGGTHTPTGGTNSITWAATKVDTTIILPGTQVFSSVQLMDAQPTLEPVISANTTDNQSGYRMFFANGTLQPNISTASTYNAVEFGSYVSVPQFFIKEGSHASAQAVLPLMYGYRSGGMIGDQARATVFAHYKVDNVAITGSAQITTQVGVDIAALTSGGTDIGVRIAKADTYSMQLTDTSGDPSGGITFGTDVSLFRPASGSLGISGVLSTTGYAVGANLGVDGTFESQDGKTVTVEKGIITGIV